jgi:peptide deformylase
MIAKEIIQIGNPLLKQKALFVSDINSKKVKSTIQNLVDTMRHYNLIGIAASQIGDNSRMFVTEVRKTKTRNPEKDDKLRIYSNPRIVWESKKRVVIYEGCGSVAYGKFFGPVKRPEKVIIEAFDRDGNKFRLESEGLLARVIQHEYDHLKGIEFTEKITDMRKVMSSEEYRKRN